MEQIVARIFSWVFHPLLMCTYATILYYFTFFLAGYGTPWSLIGMRIVVIFVATFVLPALWVLTWKRLGYIRNLQMPEKNDRRFPLLIVTLMYAAVFYVLKTKSIPAPLDLFLLGALMVQTLALLITLYWKISLHAIGIGGVTGLFTGLYILSHDGLLWVLLALYVLSGFICAARLVLGAHRPAEVYAGWLLGFATELALVFSLQHIYGM